MDWWAWLLLGFILGLGAMAFAIWAIVEWLIEQTKKYTRTMSFQIGIVKVVFSGGNITIVIAP